MINNGEIPNDYKKIKFAIVPQSWKSYRISELCQVVSGGTPSTTEEKYWNGDIPWCTPTDITKSSKYISKTDKYITEKGLKKSSATLLPKNSILMCSRATIGPRSINTNEMATNQGFKSFICNEKKLDYEYFYYLLSIYVPHFKKLASGSTFAEISKKDVESTRVIVPNSIEEQKKIASILSTWDKAIELKEKLIEQKKEQKKGLMQKLLTGEVRIPGFKDEWKIVRLGEIGKTYNGLSGKSAEDFGEGKPYIPYKTIFDDAKIDLNKLDYVEIEAGENQNSAKYGDVFFTTSSETPDEVAMSSVLLDHVNVIYLNSFCFGYRLNDFSVLLPEFAQFLFRSDGFRRKTFSLAQGSTRFNISKNEVMKIEVSLPSIEEQKSIAEILSYSDKEIKLLDKQVDFLKQQKKGLMQLLLTGKVRVQV